MTYGVFFVLYCSFISQCRLSTFYQLTQNNNTDLIVSMSKYNKTLGVPIRSTNKELINHSLILHSANLFQQSPLLINPFESTKRNISIRFLDTSNFRIEEIKFTLLTKNKNNTYSPSRDNRIFATDSGYAEITIIFQSYTSDIFEGTYFSISLGKGISLIKHKVENNVDYEINLNSTCSNVTFLNPFIIQSTYARVIYIEYSPAYLFETDSLNYDQTKYRPLIYDISIGNKMNSITFPNAETFIRFHEDGNGLREKLNINLKQLQDDYNKKPFVIRFEFDFIFVPELDSYLDYYFAILKTEAINNDGNNFDDYKDEWEVIACKVYSNKEYDYIVNDCNKNSLNDCLYYYKLELYYDKWNSRCIDGYLSSSNVVLFPIELKDNTTKPDNDNNQEKQPKEAQEIDLVTLILGFVIAMLGFILLFLFVYISFKIYSAMNKLSCNQEASEESKSEHDSQVSSKCEVSDQGIKEEDHHHREENYRSNHCFLENTIIT